MEGSEEKKHHLTGIQLRQSPPSLGAFKLSHIFAFIHFCLQSYPSSIDQGWHLVDGLCLPIHFTQPPLPSSISLPTNPQAQLDDSDNDSQSEDCDSDSCGSYSDNEA